MSAHLTLYELDALAEIEGPRSSPHLDQCAQCQHELAVMCAARDRFRLSVFPRTAPEIERKLARRWWRLAPWLVLAPALAVAVVVLLPRQAPQPDLGSLGIKGAATLRLFARSGDRVSEVSDGAELEPGDALRFEIQPGGFPYLLVGSVDAAGTAGIIFPMEASESGRIDPLARFVLPGSAVLDAAPGPERAFVWLSTQPLSAEGAKAAMRALASGGASALRATTSLRAVHAEAQLSILWEKKTP